MPIEWQTALEPAYTLARQQNRKLLLFSFSPEGAGAAKFERNIFSNSNVQAAISSHYVPLRLNVVSDREMVHRLGLYRGNIVVIYDSSGKALTQITDCQTAEEFLEHLGSVL